MATTPRWRDDSRTTSGRGDPAVPSARPSGTARSQHGGLRALALLIAASSCGHVAGDGESLSASAGSAGVSAAGSASAGASAGGSASAGESGKVGGAGGSVPVFGTGGVGGAPLPEATCDAQPSSVSCSEPCRLVYATRLRCTRSPFDLQLADTGLLLEWKEPDPALSVEQSFDFSAAEAGLIRERSFGPDSQRRVLTRDSARNVLLEQKAGGFAISPFSVAEVPGSGLPLAARIEGETLHLLTKQATNMFTPGPIHELKIERAGNVVERTVYPSALDARFVVAHPPSALLVVRPSQEPSALALLRNADAPFLLFPAELGVRAVKNGEGIALATPMGRSIEVSDQAGMHLLTKGVSSAGQCPGNFTAYNPDICETKHSSASLEQKDQVLAATVVYTQGAPWLVSITGVGTAECRLTPFNSCIETRPCDCGYRLVESTFHATLELTRIDLRALSYHLDLGKIPGAPLRLEASSAGDSADFTVAIASQGSNTVDYLLIRGE